MPIQLVLASSSPRRQELLKFIGLPFEVMPSRFDESAIAESDPSKLVSALAEAKCLEVMSRIDADGRGASTGDVVVLAADTVVAAELDGQLRTLGKPADGEDARRMLTLLSSRWHTVLTGLCLRAAPTIERTPPDSPVVVETRVRFNELTSAKIDWYVDTGEPFDKAGGYGIQGHASLFVEAIDGDYFNVVGLPVQTVARLLEQAGIEWWRGEVALA